MDGIRPTISFLGSDGDGVYVIGDVIVAVARFNEEIIVEGAPQLALDFNGVAKAATLRVIVPKCGMV